MGKSVSEGGFGQGEARLKNASLYTGWSFVLSLCRDLTNSETRRRSNSTVGVREMRDCLPLAGAAYKSGWDMASFRLPSRLLDCLRCRLQRASSHYWAASDRWRLASKQCRSEEVVATLAQTELHCESSVPNADGDVDQNVGGQELGVVDCVQRMSGYGSGLGSVTSTPCRKWKLSGCQQSARSFPPPDQYVPLTALGK